MKNFESLLNSILGKTKNGIGILGKGKDKLQGDYHWKMLRCLKFFAFLAMQQMPFIEEEKEKIAFAKEKMKACRLHMCGDHSLCTHENARCHEHHGYILQNRAEFGQEQRDKIVKHLFIDKLETDAWIKNKLIMPGNTSGNENYHSLMVNRGLVNKDAKVDVELNTIDAKYALGTYFFNSGATETFKSLFNHDEQLSWKISDHSLTQINRYEIQRKTNPEEMKKKKEKIMTKRSNQQKFQANPLHLLEPGTYITRKQKRNNPFLSDEVPHCASKKKNK